MTENLPETDPGDFFVPEWHLWPIDGRTVALRILVVPGCGDELRRLEIERAARAWRRDREPRPLSA
jgi:hypothetical protein